MMAAYKAKYEEAQARIAELEKQINDMTNLDGMSASLTNADAKEVFVTLVDRCQNRAEVSMLVRALSRLGA
jgi:hypothetical protein